MNNKEPILFDRTCFIIRESDGTNTTLFDSRVFKSVLQAKRYVIIRRKIWGASPYEASKGWKAGKIRGKRISKDIPIHELSLEGLTLTIVPINIKFKV